VAVRQKAENRKQESEWVRRILGFNTRFRAPKELRARLGILILGTLHLRRTALKGARERVALLAISFLKGQSFYRSLQGAVRLGSAPGIETP
jgi:hypothetical protein